MPADNSSINFRSSSLTSFQLLGALLLLFFTCLTYLGVQQIANQTSIDNQNSQEQLHQFQNMKVALHAVTVRLGDFNDANSEQEIFESQRFLAAANENLREALNNYQEPMLYVHPDTKTRLSALLTLALSFQTLQQEDIEQAQGESQLVITEMEIRSLEDLVFSHLTLLGDIVIDHNQKRNESRQKRLSWFIFCGVFVAILYLLGFLYLFTKNKKSLEKLKLNESDIEQVRKKSNESLIRSEEKFFKAFNASPHIFIISDLSEGKIVEVNAAFTRLCGWTYTEAVGKKSVDLHLWSKDERERFVEAIKELGSISNVDTVFTTKAGEARMAIISAEIIELADRPCLLAIVEDITDRKIAEMEVLESRERLRNLARRLEEVREEERIGIARELHDELGQALTGLKIDLSNLPDKTASSEQSAAHIEMMLGNIDTTIDVVRRMSSELRPPILDDLGLEAALESLSNDFSQRTGISCTLDFECDALPIHKTWNTAIYRIYQESLVNIARHSEAKRFEASACIIDDALVVRVKDDGIGISQEQIEHSTSIGVLGMQERAANIGAKFSIGNSDLGGVEVVLVAPLQK